MVRRVLIRVVSVVSVLMFLSTSCAFAPKGEKWVRGGADEEQIEEAVGNCNALGILLFPLVWGKPCMKKQGYRLEPDEVASN